MCQSRSCTSLTTSLSKLNQLRNESTTVSRFANGNMVISTATTNNINNGQIIATQPDMGKFRRSINSATHLIFHQRTGLPLTSSPVSRLSHFFVLPYCENAILCFGILLTQFAKTTTRPST